MASGYLILCARRGSSGETLRFITSEDAPRRAVERLEAQDPAPRGHGRWRIAEFDFVADTGHALARAEGALAPGLKMGRPAVREFMGRIAREEAARLELRLRTEGRGHNPYARPRLLSGPEGRLAAQLADAVLGARLTAPPLEAFLSDFALGYAWSALSAEARARKLPKVLWPSLLEDVVLRRWGRKLSLADAARVERLLRERPAEFRLGEFAFARAVARSGPSEAVRGLHPLLRAPRSHLAATLGDYKKRVLRTLPMRARRTGFRLLQLLVFLGLAVLAETAGLTGGIDGAINALAVVFLGVSGLIATDCLRVPDFARRLGKLGEEEWRGIASRVEQLNPYTLEPVVTGGNL